MKDLDHDKNGRVSFKEYAKYVARLSSNKNFAEELDRNADEALLEDLQTLVPALRTLLQEGPPSVSNITEASDSSGKEARSFLP